MKLALVAAALAAVLYGLHRLAVWAERRGWIYYRERKGGGALGNALLEVHALLEPSRRRVIEVRRRDEEENDASGDPPAPGTDERLEAGHAPSNHAARLGRAAHDERKEPGR